MDAVGVADLTQWHKVELSNREVPEHLVYNYSAISCFYVIRVVHTLVSEIGFDHTRAIIFH